MMNRIIYLITFFAALWLMIMYDGISCEIIFASVCAVPIVAMIINFIVIKNISAHWNITGVRPVKGEKSKITAIINNDCIFPVGRIEIIFSIEDISGHKEEMSFATNLMPDANKKCVIQLLPQYAGPIKIIMTHIKTYDFLGISYKRKKIGSYINLVVKPCGRVETRRFEKNVQIKVDEGDVFSEAYPGNDRSEIFDTAVYKEGDNIRDVHWKLSSKTDELMVKRYSQPICSDTNIYIDIDVSDKNKFTMVGIDYYFSYFDSLINELMADGNMVKVYVYDKEKDVYVGRNQTDAMAVDFTMAPSEAYVYKQIHTPVNQGRNIILSNRLKEEENVIFINTKIEEKDKKSDIGRNISLATKEDDINDYSYVFRVLMIMTGVLGAMLSFSDTLFIHNSYKVKMVIEIIIFTLAFVAAGFVKKKGIRRKLQLLIIAIVALMNDPFGIVQGTQELIQALAGEMCIYTSEKNVLEYGLLEENTDNLNAVISFISAILCCVLYEFTWNVPSRVVHFVFTLPFFGAAFVFGCSPGRLSVFIYACYFFMIMVYGINYYSIAKKEKNIKKKAYYESTVNIGALTGFIAVIVIVTVTILDMAKGYHRSDWMVEIKQEINSILSDFTKKAYYIRAESATGGMNEGKLGEVDNIEYSDEVHLEVTVSGNIKYPMYLRGFTGTYYTGVSWEKNSDEVNRRIETEMKYMDSDLQGIFNETYDLLANNRINTKETIKNAYVMVKNNLQDNKVYVPYGAYYTGLLEGDGIPGETDQSENAYDVYQVTSVDNIEPDDIDSEIRSSMYREVAEELYLNSQYTGEYLEKIDRIIPSQYQYNNKIYNLRNYDDVMANGHVVYIEFVRRYLRDNYNYSISPGKLEIGNDFVEQFMEQKEGYCVYFATLGTLMFREMGIPARYVEGYYVKPDQNGLVTYNNTGDVNIQVTDRNAHAWTEIYILNYGWIPVEVTPGYTGVNYYSVKNASEENQTYGSNLEKTTTKNSESTTKGAEKETTIKKEENTSSYDKSGDGQGKSRNSDDINDTDSGAGFKVNKFILWAILIAAGIGFIVFRQNKKISEMEKIFNKRGRAALSQTHNEFKRALILCGYNKNINTDNKKLAEDIARYLSKKIIGDLRDTFDVEAERKRILAMLESFDRAMYANSYEIEREEKKRTINCATDVIYYFYYTNRMLKRLYLKYIKCLYLKQK